MNSNKKANLIENDKLTENDNLTESANQRGNNNLTEMTNSVQMGDLKQMTKLSQSINPNQNKTLKNGFRKLISLALTVTLVLSSVAFASAGNMTPMAPVLPQAGGQVQVYLKPDVNIIVDGQEKIFCDVNNEVVYPIIYNGSTYLPIRAISALMGENIEGDAYSKTVFMGKTLSNPNKVMRLTVTTSGITAEIIQLIKPDPSRISAYSRPNFLIMYDFRVLTFNDEQGNQVFPIVVYGSVYLPIRAISGIMNQTIEWDGIDKTITIGSPDIPVIEKSAATKTIISQFEKQIQLYDSATVKIQNIKKAANLDELMILATEVSKDYVYAEANTLEVNSIETADYNEKELAAYASLKEFTQISEHYILVLENIAYMAAAEADYSMLAETFMTFAMESQSRLDETRVLVDAL